MKMQLLDHLCESLDKFGNVGFLGASGYEHMNVVHKKTYQRTSIERESKLPETPFAMESIVKGL